MGARGLRMKLKSCSIGVGMPWATGHGLEEEGHPRRGRDES